MNGKRGKALVALSVLLTGCLAGGTLVACGGSGFAGKPVGPIDESGFGGGVGAGTNSVLETDSNMSVDGKLDEAGWNESVPLTYICDGNIQISVKTLYGEKGVYIGAEVKDGNLCGNDMRNIVYNSGIEFYLDAGNQKYSGPNTIRYRHDVLDTTSSECVLQKDSWAVQYKPMFSRMELHGEVNSGNTEGATWEIFASWAAFGYENFENDPEFVKPDSVGIFPAYNRSEGPNNEDKRLEWCSPSGWNGRPDTYFRFGESGYQDADAAGVRIGDASIGRNKSNGWTIAGSAAEETATAVSPYGAPQIAFFKNFAARDYAVTAKVKINESTGDFRSGLVIAAGHNKVYSFVADKNFQNGYFITNNQYRHEDTEQKSATKPISANISEQTFRITVVKKDGVMYAFVGDGSAAQFGGEFVSFMETAETEATVPGFYTNNCGATFSDYEVSEDADKINEIISGKISRLVVNNSVGGAIRGGENYFYRDDQTTLTVDASNGYYIKELKVNKTDVLDTEAFKNGVLTVTMNADTVTVEPVFEKFSSETQTYSVNGRIVLDKDLYLRDVSVLVVGDNKSYTYRPVVATRVPYTQEEAAGEKKEEAANCNRYAYDCKLPNGNYTVTVRYGSHNVYSENVTVNGENVTLTERKFSFPFGASAVGSPQWGTWVYDSENNRYTLADNANPAAVYLKNQSATKYSFETTIKLNDTAGTPKVGIVLAASGTRVIMVGIQSAKGDNYEQYQVFDMPGWNAIETGIPPKGNGNSEVSFKVLRSGDAVYLWINDTFVGRYTASWLQDTTPTTVGLASFIGTSSQWYDWEYSEDGEKIDEQIAAVMREVKVTVNGEAYCELSSESVALGSSVTMQLFVADGYFLRSVMVDGVEMLEDVNEKGVLTLKNITEDVNIIVDCVPLGDFAEISGSYTFGTFAEGENVEIYFGTIKAEVNEANKTFTANVPAGTYNVKLSSSTCFGTARITISEDGGAIGELVFDTVRYQGTQPQQGNNGALFPQKTAKLFANAATKAGNGNAFAVKATMKYGAGNEWQATGFVVKTPSTQYEIAIGWDQYGWAQPVRICIRTTGDPIGLWDANTLKKQGYNTYGLKAGADWLNDGVEFGLIFKDGVYSLIADGVIIGSFDQSFYADGDEEKFADLFSTSVQKELGIASSDTNGEVWNVRYTFNEAEFASYYPNGIQLPGDTGTKFTADKGAEFVASMEVKIDAAQVADNNLGGFAFDCNGKTLKVLFGLTGAKGSADRKSQLVINDVSTGKQVNYVLPDNINLAGNDFVNVRVVFKSDTYYITVGGTYTVLVTADALGGSSEFFTNTSKTIGVGSFGTVHSRRIVYKNLTYSFETSDISDAVADAESKAEKYNLSVSVTGNDMGSASFSADKVFKGQSAMLTINVNEGYRLVSVKNGSTVLDLNDFTINGNVYTLKFTNIAEDISITVELEVKAVAYAVTGSFDYAEGLYSAGDTVTVKSGTETGTANMTDKTFSINLYDGADQTIVLSSARFADVTLTVSVNGAAATAGKATFQYVKLANNGATQDLASQQVVMFPEAQTQSKNGNAFAVKANMKYSTADKDQHWLATGFVIKTSETDQYEIAFGWNKYGWHGSFRITHNNSDSDGAWSVNTLDKLGYNTYGLQAGESWTTDGVVVGLIFKNGVYSLIADGIIIGSFDYSMITDSYKENYRALFETTNRKEIGIVGAFSNATGTVWNACYTFDEAQFASYYPNGIQLPQNGTKFTAKKGAEFVASMDVKIDAAQAGEWDFGGFAFDCNGKTLKILFGLTGAAGSTNRQSKLVFRDDSGNNGHVHYTLPNDIDFASNFVNVRVVFSNQTYYITFDGTYTITITKTTLTQVEEGKEVKNSNFAEDFFTEGEKTFGVGTWNTVHSRRILVKNLTCSFDETVVTNAVTDAQNKTAWNG